MPRTSFAAFCAIGTHAHAVLFTPPKSPTEKSTPTDPWSARHCAEHWPVTRCHLQKGSHGSAGIAAGRKVQPGRTAQAQRGTGLQGSRRTPARSASRPPAPVAARGRRHVLGSRSKARKTALVFRPEPRGRARLPREWPGDALPAAPSPAQPTGSAAAGPRGAQPDLRRTPARSVCSACSACSAGCRRPPVSSAGTPPREARTPSPSRLLPALQGGGLGAGRQRATRRMAEGATGRFPCSSRSGPAPLGSPGAGRAVGGQAAI